MNFSTPFTCTEIIAHMKTLKYLALASKKISVGAEDNTKMFLILRGNLGNRAPDRPLPGGNSAARNAVFIFVCLLFFFFLFQGQSCM